MIAAWKTFDAAVQAVPGLAGSPEVLALFRLNDATWTRALWFVVQPDTNELAPLLADLGKRADTVGLRITLAPPRVAWARRYAALLEGPARSLVELQEARRFRDDEERLAALETELVAMLSDANSAARPAADWSRPPSTRRNSGCSSTTARGRASPTRWRCCGGRAAAVRRRRRSTWTTSSGPTWISGTLWLLART